MGGSQGDPIGAMLLRPLAKCQPQFPYHLDYSHQMIPPTVSHSHQGPARQLVQQHCSLISSDICSSAANYIQIWYKLLGSLSDCYAGSLRWPEGL